MDAVTSDIQFRVKRTRRSFSSHIPIREHHCDCRGRNAPRAPAPQLQPARNCEKVQGFWRWRRERTMRVRCRCQVRPCSLPAVVLGSVAAIARNVVHELLDRGKGGDGSLVDSESDHVAAEIGGGSLGSRQPHVHHGIGAYWLAQVHGVEQCAMAAHVPDRLGRGRAKSLLVTEAPKHSAHRNGPEVRR
jgi:hypothetical protein